MAFDDTLVYRKLRTPQQDHGLLLEPSWSECRSKTSANHELLASYDFDWLGTTFQELRREARASLLELAAEYTGEYLELERVPNSATAPLVISGHQPTLFHPGVWAKNFAIGKLARQLEGLAIQVVIDNDLMRGHAVVCPSGSFEDPHRVSEPFDRFHQPIPYEMRFVQDRELFGSFADRIADRLDGLVAQPIVQEIWPMACEAVDAGRAIGSAFALARHRMESRWGLNTLEVPLSRLCETTAFRQFAGYLLCFAERVQVAYNRRLAEYRTVHGIRNHAQPLPNLRSRESWTETPLWIWQTDNPDRRAIWVRQEGQDLLLSDGELEICRIPNGLTQPRQIVEQLEQLSQQGHHIRPKALANTLYLRLFLADFFFHGIGGAKYDQVTDLLIYDLVGKPPPSFGVLSLTTWLPSPNPLVRHREIIHKRQHIREMFFHPERFLDRELSKNDQVSSQVKTKQKLIADKPARGAAGAWHGEMARVNAGLREFLQRKTEIEKRSLADMLQRSQASTLFSSREWSFCLFPEDFLRDRLLDLPHEDS